MNDNAYPHPIIAREGWPFLAIAAIVALVLTAIRLDFPGAAGVGRLRLHPAVLPRPAARDSAAAPMSVLSPADGRSSWSSMARDPYLDRDALKISVFMNVFNVHSNRSPVDGTVVNRWYHAGSFLNAALDKASLENERNALHLRTTVGPGRHVRADRRAHRAANPLLRRHRRRRWRGANATASSASARAWTSTSIPPRSRAWRWATSSPRPKRSWRNCPDR